MKQLNIYIYTNWQNHQANHFLDYIYNVAKDSGKSSEIQTHNYRQLQMQIKGKQTYKQTYKYNYRYIYIAIQRIITTSYHKISIKNRQKIARLSQDFNKIITRF